MPDDNPFFFALIPDAKGKQLCVRWEAVQVCEIAPDDKLVTLYFEGVRQFKIDDPEVIKAFLISVGLRTPKSNLIEVPDIIGSGAIKRDFPVQ